MKAKTFSDKSKSSRKPLSIVLSVVSIIELIILLTTMTFSWFEGITSLEITGTDISTASGLKSKFIVGEGTDYQTTAELNEFFYSQSFDKLSPVSSYDGETFYALYDGEATSYSEYLSGIQNKTLKFRELSEEEKNSSIIYFQFEVDATSSDTTFWLKKMPTVKINGTTLANNNNPFRIRIDDGDGDAANGEGNLILTTKESWPTTGPVTTTSSLGRANMKGIAKLDDEGNNTAILNDTYIDENNKAAGELMCNRASYKIFSKTSTLNKNGSQILFTVDKGVTRTITIAIWLEALDQSYSETLIPPGATVEFDIEFCSSWDVVDTITFRDYTSDQWVDTYDENNSTNQRLGIANLDSDSNYYYGFTYNKTNKVWTADIPRAVQNMKFIWQPSDSTTETAKWEAAERGTETVFTAFGSSTGFWYSDEVVQISFADYTDKQWLNDDSPKMRVQVSYNGGILEYSMTDSPTANSTGNNTWYTYIPSTVDAVIFNRCSRSDTSVIYNYWNAPNRGTETRYYALESGEIVEVTGTTLYLNVPSDYADEFFDQNLLPAVSVMSETNIGLMENLLKANGNLYNLAQSGYVVSGAHQDTWYGDQGRMTKLSDTLFVIHFDFELEDGTYLTFWNKPQKDYNNLDNNTSFAPYMQYDANYNRLTIYDPHQLTNGTFIDAWIFDGMWSTYSGSEDGSGTTTTQPKAQAGQWGPPALPTGTYATYFYHTATTATSVTATFEYYGVDYTVTMTKDSSDAQMWCAAAGTIPDDVAYVTFTDNSGNTWTKENATGTRTSSTNYYYASSNTAGEWSKYQTDSLIIYLKPNSNWTQASAWFAVYLWNDSGSTTWARMTDSDGDGVYECEIPEGYSTNIIFCRMKGTDTSTLGWSNVWNQTSDLTIPTDGTTNMYTIASGAWSKGSGTWSTYE